MAAADIDDKQSLVPPPPSPSPQGVLRPTISSTRRSSRSPSACLGGLSLNFRVPSLPKLHRKGPLVSTKLCETRRKSYTGHVFDLSNSQEYYQFLEYNSLHDPHLKAYYYRKAMKEKLLKNGYVTGDLHVICHSLKEYNAYRNFLEFEFMKLRKQQEDEVKERERKHKSDVREQSRTSSLDKEREEKRKTFFQQQEKKLKAKQLLLRKREKKEHINKIKFLEERRMQREKNEIKREAERERRKLLQLQREHTEMLRRKSLLRQNVVEDSMRRIQLARMKQEEKLSHLKEIERRWQIYEEHAQKAKEEEERRKAEEKEEREKRMRRREKIFQILQKKEEERRQKLMEENHQQVEVLKQEADKLEQEWQKRKISEMMEWKEKTQKKIQHWQDHLEHQKEAWRKEHEKHIEELLSHPNAPQLHTSMSRTRKISADSNNNKKFGSVPISASKWVRPSSVRFDATPTVHILEDFVPEMEEEGEEMDDALEKDTELDLDLDECDNALDAIEHTDSYHLQLQLQRNREDSERLEVVDAEGSLISLSCDQDTSGENVDSDKGEKITSSEMLEEESQTTSVHDEGKRFISEQGKEHEMKESESEAEMLMVQKSTASDLVSQAMLKAVDRVTTPVEMKD